MPADVFQLRHHQHYLFVNSGMRRNFLYVINPISGVRNKSSLQKIIEKKTNALLIPYEELYTNAEKEYHYLPAKVKHSRITDVIICGGDGTVNQITEALLGVKVNIGIIPLGSGNGLAFSAKIPHNVDAALEIIFNGKSGLIDAFYINSMFSCMLCGVGFDAQVAHNFSREKKAGFSNLCKAVVEKFCKRFALYFFCFS